jgi:hypothetical protein
MMTAHDDRPGTSEAAYEALKAEIMRAAVEMSCAQVMDLTDSLHCVLRLRRPGRPVHSDGWREAEARCFETSREAPAWPTACATAGSRDRS